MRERGAGMGKRMLGGLLLVVCLLGLGGCVFGSVDEMYALPKSSEAYVNLQAKINEEKGTGEYIAPLNGENRQTIQLVDVDEDGLQEAVAFFRDADADTPLRIVIFKQDDQGEYQVYARIQGVGSEIDSIEYVNLGGAGESDVLVSWQAGSSLRTLVGYTITDGQPTEIMRSAYDRYLTADLDGDGQEEVVLAQAEEESSSTRIEYYDSRDGVLTLTATSPLSDGTTDISSWSAGWLEETVPALFVTSYFGRDVLLTDVFVLDDQQGLRNIAWNPETRRSDSTFHYYTGVAPEDINGRLGRSPGGPHGGRLWREFGGPVLVAGLDPLPNRRHPNGDDHHLPQRRRLVSGHPRRVEPGGGHHHVPAGELHHRGAQRHIRPGRPGRGEHPGALFGDLLPDRQRPQPPSGPKQPVHPL